MAGWSCKDAEEIEWNGTIKAKNGFVGDGSKLKNISAAGDNLGNHIATQTISGAIIQGTNLISTNLITAPYQSCAIAYLFGDQSINSATWTLVAANTEIKDMQSEYNTGTYAFTPSVLSGNYMVFANIYFSTMAAGDIMAVAIYLNGSIYNQTRNIAGIAGDYSLGISAIVPATAKFEIYVYHNHGSARNITGGQTYSTIGFNRLN